MSITAIDMARQLGRWWAGSSTQLLSFCEPTSTNKANIYATALPARTRRLSPGISITQLPTASNSAMEVAERMSLRIHAVAPTPEESAALLDELVDLLWPDQRPILPRDGAYTAGIIGVPLEAGTHELWRVVEFVQQVPPFTSNIRSSEGEIITSMTIEIHAVEDTVTVE